MSKQILLIILCVHAAAVGWSATGDPYIGEVATSWATTNAVVATAGSTNEFTGDFSPANMISGYAFQALDGPLSKPAYEGASYNTDGTRHTYSVTGSGWLGNKYHPSGLPHPSGRATTNNNNYAQNWISFEFDKPYEIVSFDIWNGSYGGGPGAGGDFSLRDVYVDYKTNGTWQMAESTIRLARVPDIFAFFRTTDNIAVGLDKVTQVVITPINSWSEDTSWYPLPADPYESVKACVSEIRFYVSPTVALSITRNGADVTVSWPADVTGYVLESSELLGAGASWNSVDGVVNNSVTIPNPTGVQFYRLRK